MTLLVYVHVYWDCRFHISQDFLIEERALLGVDLGEHHLRDISFALSIGPR